MSRLRAPWVMLGLLLAAITLPAGPPADAGCCHVPNGGCPRGPAPSPLVGLREPFDPPPSEPEGPPSTPPPPEEGGGSPGAPPTTPSEPSGPLPLPGRPTTPPSPPSSTPPTPDVTTPRRGVAPSLETLSESSWQFWWALNQLDVLPRIRRQTTVETGPYARELLPELRPAVDLLIAALHDEAPDVRYAAAGALAGFVSEYRAQDTLAALREGARGPDRWLRDLCHIGLGLRKDADSAQGLRRVALARHEPDVARVFAALGLIQLGGSEALSELQALAQDLRSPEVAGGVLVGLGGTRDPAHLPTLLEAARRRAGSAPRLRRVRADALTALGHMAHPSTVPYLAGLLEDRENVIARSAAIALGGFKGNADAALALGRACSTAEDPWIRALAAVSLGRVGATQGLPHLARMAREERNAAVLPFTILAIGLTGVAGGERLLADSLAEDPRTGTYGAAALATGLLKAGEQRPWLEAALTDTRTHLAPGCAALACGLLGAHETRAVLRQRFWLDSARVRPGFDRALSLLGAEEHATWLVGQLGQTRRSGARRGLLEALALCSGPTESATLVASYAEAPKGDTLLRTRVILALAAVLRDHEVTYARRLLMHTYYLQSNDALNHLGAMP